jgi:hypothetical protein
MNISLKISVKPVAAFLKKYAALLPSIVILLVALLLLLPLLMIGNAVKKSMAQSVSTARQVQSALSDVPSKDKPQQVKFYMSKLEEEAALIESLALESCRRDLVTYDNVIFPKPLDSSAQVFHEFGRKYRAAIEELLTSIKALDAPSEAEIRARTGQASAGTRGMAGGMRTANIAKDPMVDALCLSRAQEISVYAHPTAFAWYEFWEKYTFAGEKQALEDCWDAQAALWIYEDIIDTIQKMNGTNSTVASSAVKRLMGVSFSGPVVTGGAQLSMYSSEMMMSGRNAAGSVRDIPNYVTDSLPSYFVTVSPTGRTGSQEVDIVHFAVSVLVDNRFVLAFQKELCSEKAHSYRTDFLQAGARVDTARHNQITILQSDLRVVDPQAVEHELYRYGKGAVMQLDLVCEYQFYRKSYEAILPAPILERLGQAADAAGGAAPAPAPMGGMQNYVY